MVTTLTLAFLETRAYQLLVVAICDASCHSHVFSRLPASSRNLAMIVSGRRFSGVCCPSGDGVRLLQFYGASRAFSESISPQSKTVHETDLGGFSRPSANVILCSLCVDDRNRPVLHVYSAGTVFCPRSSILCMPFCHRQWNVIHFHI